MPGFCCLSRFMGSTAYSEATESSFPGILYIDVHVRSVFRFLMQYPSFVCRSLSDAVCQFLRLKHLLVCGAQFRRRRVSAVMAKMFAPVSSTVWQFGRVSDFMAKIFCSCVVGTVWKTPCVGFFYVLLVCRAQFLQTPVAFITRAPLCNRPTGARPSGLFCPAQWKLRLPSSQRMILFYSAIFMLPQWLCGVTQRIFRSNK